MESVPRPSQPAYDDDDDLASERESTMLRAAMAADVTARSSQSILDAEEPARVLVADDDAATRDLIATIVDRFGRRT